MNNYKIKAVLATVAIIIFSVLFFFAPAVMIEGIRNGLTVCGRSIIPSLLPFLVISDFILRSGIGDMAGRKLSPLTEKLFHMPGTAGCAILLSLFGGFPVGAKMAAQLYTDKKITRKQCQRMMLFCVNAGPAFVVGTVGSSMLSNKKAGIILFVSLTVTSLIIGIISGIFSKEKIKADAPTARFNSAVLPDSVNSSVQAILGVCAWILLFSGMNAYLLRLPVGKNVAVILSMLSEVTGGCLRAANTFPPFVCALVIGWSGAAVHCQLMPYLNMSQIKLRTFWLFRAINGIVASLLSFVLFRLFPCDIDVFSSSSELISKPFSVSAPAAAAMLILSAIMLIDIPCTKSKDML